MTGAQIVAKKRRNLGVRVTWAQAEEILDLSRRAIQGRLWDALSEVARGYAQRQSILEGGGFQARIGPYEVWIARRGRNYVVRIKQ